MIDHELDDLVTHKEQLIRDIDRKDKHVRRLSAMQRRDIAEVRVLLDEAREIVRRMT